MSETYTEKVAAGKGDGSGPSPDDLIGTVQAAAIAGVHQRTIIAWVKAGWLEARRRPGPKGRYLIRLGDLQEVAFGRYEHG